MTTPNHYTSIALKYREIANLFDAIGGQEAPLASTVAADPAPAKPRGRPAKVETPAAPASPVIIAKEEPKVDDTKVTADHADRLALKKVAGELIAATDKATAQNAVKLFGENTNVIPDCQCGAAVAHLTALLRKKQANNDDV